MIEESKALCDVPNEEADCFIDGMTAVDAVNFTETLEDHANKFLEFCKPKHKVKQLLIIFDSYKEISIKQMTQLKNERLSWDVFITNLQKKMPNDFDWFSDMCLIEV